ncbi:AGAP001344-PA-like protein [Anopheles sinensis]|uniref:AGAP001344-PA-like protein n=1 Tax=Anopheles sinensis TaxID=74873 RepID=A0A084VS75_ANOSI|nr:AGAP001344-PA-like protein [Anopheles sinensis]
MDEAPFRGLPKKGELDLLWSDIGARLLGALDCDPACIDEAHMVPRKDQATLWDFWKASIDWRPRNTSSQERSAPAMSDRLKNERSSSYKKDGEMTSLTSGGAAAASSSPRTSCASSSSLAAPTTTASVLSLHQSPHQSSLHHLQHHLQHLHQPPGASGGSNGAAENQHHHLLHHHHQPSHHPHAQQQGHLHQHQHQGVPSSGLLTGSGLTALVPGHHSPLNSPASSSGGGSSLSPYGLSPHHHANGTTPSGSTVGSNMLGQPYASDASGFGPIYHHHHHHHHHNPLGTSPAPYMGHHPAPPASSSGTSSSSTSAASFADKYKQLSGSPPPPAAAPSTLTPPGAPTYTGHYQGFYATGPGMVTASHHHAMAHGARAIACRDRPEHAWYP